LAVDVRDSARCKARVDLAIAEFGGLDVLVNNARRGAEAAAAIPSSPALGIALVNTVGYLGCIGGPLALGLVSEQLGLETAFLLVLVAMLVIAFGCRRVTALKSSPQIAAARARSSPRARPGRTRPSLPTWSGVRCGCAGFSALDA
jgi:NAD(P)-dependent dehydrogenase (short-subunit alcohol dehydrogenase family)